MSSRPGTTPLRTTRLLFAAIGAAEGAVWWWVHPFGVETPGARTARFCGLFFATSAALVARFTWTGAELARWAALSLGFGALVALVTLQVWSELPAADVAYEGDGSRIGAWALGAFVLLYVAVPFAQIFQRSGRLRFPYPPLFEHSWGNLFIGLVAVLFVQAVWALLGLWAQLFQLLGVPLFADLFSSRPFAYLATFALFGFGLAVGRDSERVIQALRTTTGMVARALLPLVVLIALLFLATLPLTGLRPLWETGRATPVVLALLGAFAVLLNGVLQDGSEAPGYPGPMTYAIQAAVLTMPAYALIAWYGTGSRVHQYGLTPDRIYALLFTAVSTLYCVGYAAGVLRRHLPFVDSLARVNIASAFIVAALAIAVQLPPLDPMRLSAASQVQRLLDGRVAPDAFDFATLRFRLGHHGWERLLELDARADHPEAARIREKITRVRLARDFHEARSEERRREARFPILRLAPRGLAIPEGLVERLTPDLDGTCDTPRECVLIGGDLDGDGTLEYCLYGDRFHSFCYARAEPSARWGRIGRFVYGGEGSWPSVEAVESEFASEPLPLRSPRFAELVVNRGAFQLIPER